MALFRYKALSATGESLDGQMEAANADEVIVRLQDQGYLPVEALRADQSGEAISLFSLGKKRELNAAQILQFTQQLATLLGAGQPLDRALGILIELPETAAARKVLERIRETVRGGAPLSVALEQQHGLFSRLYVNLVRAGESGGGLDDALRRLADYLERSRELRSRVTNALTYPVFLLGLVFVSVAILLVGVVPQFEALFASLNAELAWYTQAVLWLSSGLRNGWPLILAGLLLFAWWLNNRIGDPAWRLAMDARMLANRYAGPLIGRLETARLARTLGTLVGNGVPLLTALNLSGNVLSNRVLANALEAASSEVKSGSGLGYALGRQKVFPRLAVQMIQVGEESGELDTLLIKVADTFDVETRNALDRLLVLLVPALTILMAVIVAAIILSVLLPIYDLTGNLG
jgi:general secretion pathway protein F